MVSAHNVTDPDINVMPDRRTVQAHHVGRTAGIGHDADARDGRTVIGLGGVG
jgi:hypothetical protein